MKGLAVDWYRWSAIPRSMHSTSILSMVIGLATLPLTACGDSKAAGDDIDAGNPTINTHASDVPINGLSAADVASFFNGDSLFDLAFRDPDGLGPLFVRIACGDCHDGAARGPGLTQKMSVVEADGYTTAADQSALPYGHTIRQGLTAGAVTPIVPPTRLGRSKRQGERRASARRSWAAVTWRRSRTPRSCACRPSSPRAPTASTVR